MSPSCTYNPVLAVLFWLGLLRWLSLTSLSFHAFSVLSVPYWYVFPVKVFLLVSCHDFPVTFLVTALQVVLFLISFATVRSASSCHVCRLFYKGCRAMEIYLLKIPKVT
jgi:hypothetical protein